MWGNGRDKKCLEWRRNRSEKKGMGKAKQCVAVRGKGTA